MREELESRLIKDFPNLYRRPLPYGFEFDDGWYDLVWELSDKLEALIVKEEDSRSFYVLQTKEKFGELRFYLYCYTDEMFDLISEYKSKSLDICEVCGNKGKRANLNGWLRVVCKEHETLSR